MFFLLFAFLTPCISAFSVSSITVNPPGDTAAGTPLTVTVAIDFPPDGTVSFPSDSELQLSTNLADARWEPVLFLDGVKTELVPKTGKSLILQGWYLSYPRGQNAKLRVTLTGNLPQYLSSGQNLVKIQETDSGHRIVSTAYVEMPAAPVTTLPTPTKKPATTKITPVPMDTPAQKSPLGTGAGIFATMIVALLVIQKK
jgi:hypothetical protein